jgi:hypothetical protein
MVFSNGMDEGAVREVTATARVWVEDGVLKCTGLEPGNAFEVPCGWWRFLRVSLRGGTR